MEPEKVIKAVRDLIGEYEINLATEKEAKKEVLKELQVEKTNVSKLNQELYELRKFKEKMAKMFGEVKQ